MARNDVFSQRRRLERIDGFDNLSPSYSHDVNVFTVNDSLVHRKVIERLLKITSRKSMYLINFSISSILLINYAYKFLKEFVVEKSSNQWIVEDEEEREYRAFLVYISVGVRKKAFQGFFLLIYF